MMRKFSTFLALLCCIITLIFTPALASADPADTTHIGETTQTQLENVDPDKLTQEEISNILSEHVTGPEGTPIEAIRKAIIEKSHDYAKGLKSENLYERGASQCVINNLRKNMVTVFSEIKAGKTQSSVDMGKLNAVERNCKAENVVRHPKDATKHAASSLWNDGIGKAARAALDGVQTMLGTTLQLWGKADLFPQMGGQAPAMTGVRSYTLDLQIILMVVGIIIASVKLAIERQKALLDGATEVASMLVRTGIAAFLLPSAVLLLHHAGDAFSIWVLNSSSGGNVQQALDGITLLDNNSPLGPMAVLIVALFTILGTFVQIISLVVREALLIVVVALAPIVASMSAIPGGKRSWDNVVAFTLAALAFKPVGSLIYAIAFWQSGSSDVPSQVTSMVLLGLSGFIMVGLVRLFIPAAAILGEGVSLAGLASTAGGAIATGGMVAAGAVGAAGATLASGGNKLAASGAAILPAAGHSSSIRSSHSSTQTATPHVPHTPHSTGGALPSAAGMSSPAGPTGASPMGGAAPVPAAAPAASAPAARHTVRHTTGKALSSAGRTMQKTARYAPSPIRAARAGHYVGGTVERFAGGAIGNYHGHISR